MSVDSIWIAISVVTAMLFLLISILYVLRSGQASSQTEARLARTDNPPGQDVIISPLHGVSFQDFMNVVKFDDLVNQRAVNQVNAILGNSTGSIVKTSVEQLRRVAKAGVSHEFSPKVQQMLADGSAKKMIHGASNRGMAIARHAKGPKGGQFIEQAKETMTRNPAKLVGAIDPVAAVVLLAHMISDADNARALAELNRKLDILTENRQIDQHARLERIFYETRLLLEEGHQTISFHERVKRSGELRLELLELRSVWRQEAERELRELRAPAEESWFSRQTTFDSTVDARLETGLRKAASKMLNIAHTVRLDNILAAGFAQESGGTDVFQHELETLRILGSLFVERAAYVKNVQRRALWMEFTAISNSRTAPLADNVSLSSDRGGAILIPRME